MSLLANNQDLPIFIETEIASPNSVEVLGVPQNKKMFKMKQKKTLKKNIPGCSSA